MLSIWPHDGKGGGNIESWLLARLMRRPWMWWSGRNADPVPNMQNPFRGHLVVLVNEWTSSDGETMAKDMAYAPLPAEVVKKAEEKIKSITYQGKPLRS